ncbi:ADP-glyceromanno-heptose 6-epimerase [Portibacter lacus]|uniref:ADP-L-glycero-D-manno-heptose-6-epimerase n=1 Tax=Portibacter lacus TaxID=1099794 RepID=A0AA37WCP0_9BACT|nr:ADP-glyceromanno-heptose 6-epimerase [Portibacter lacus]GLR16736.1 ADP-L-glycero-D-manno-heptose-6-epimerase [Portibacter lacus]
MIIVTGAAGFIGSCMISYLQSEQISDIIAIDDFDQEYKEANYIHKEGILKVDRKEAFKFIETNANELDTIIHLGARTDTVDPDPQIFLELNIDYSKQIWELCAKHQIQLIYASSAATYGDGAFGFSDQMEDISVLKPLNEYGRSKQIFDEWLLEQDEAPTNWIGLKFFNVYGPNEYHKARMASVIFHAYNQIKETGKMKLFRSHRADFENGMQLRDFIYVKDVCSTIVSLMQNPIKSGIYNLGTGKARSFLDLVTATFDAMDITPNIEYIDIPKDIRDNYQYFTEANMVKLSDEMGEIEFSSLEDGVTDYVKNYLISHKYL